MLYFTLNLILWLLKPKSKDVYLSVNWFITVIEKIATRKFNCNISCNKFLWPRFSLKWTLCWHFLREMISFCANVEEWMEKDKQNVIAIHCKGGKGRTGTMICTWLVHCGVFEEAKVSGVDPVVWGSIYMYHMQAPETLLITHIVKSSMGSKFQCVLIYIEGAWFFSFCLAVHVQWKHLWGQYLWIVKCLN